MPRVRPIGTRSHEANQVYPRSLGPPVSRAGGFRLTNLTNFIAAVHSGMSERVNIYEAKTRLSELVDKAASGEEVIIARAGTPVARLVGLKPRRRVPGAWRGKVWVSDDFDAPLSARELREFLDGTL